MPIYDFRCEHPDCVETFSGMRSIAMRDAPIQCPTCGAQARRQLVSPQLAMVSAQTRKAHDTNERSAHQPRSTRGEGHGPGCGCCRGAGRRSSDSAAGPRGFPGRRPWMISH